jgi:hypothetical protein
MLNYMLIIIFNTNTNVHVLSTWFVSLIYTLYNHAHNTLNVKYENHMIWSTTISLNFKLQYLQIYFNSRLSICNTHMIVNKLHYLWKKEM